MQGPVGATMSPVVDEQQETWIGIREAADIVGCSPYSLQKLALMGAGESEGQAAFPGAVPVGC